MSLIRKIAHNTLYQVTGRIISTILGLIVIGSMTRHLGQEGFGGYATITAFLQFFGIMADFGLILVTMQMISLPGANQNKILSNIFTLRFFSALIFLGLAPLIVIFFPYPPLVKIGVAIATLSFFFAALTQVLVGLFQKELKVLRVSLAEVLSRVVLLISVLLVIYLDKGLLAIMTVIVLGSFTNFLLNYIFALKFVRLRFAFDWSIWREIIAKSWPLALGIIFNLIYLKADTIILSLYQSQAEVGIYGAPYRVLEILISFPMMFIGLILPTLTLSWANKNYQKFKKIIQKSFDFLSIMAIPMMVATFFIAKPVMIMVAGENFAASGDVLKIIIIATAAIFLGSLFGHVMVAINKQKIMVWGYFSTAILALVAYFIFIPRYSYLGAAWSTVFAEGFINLILLYAVYKFTKFFPSLKIFAKAILASLAMAFSLYLLNGGNLWLSILVGGTVYFTVLYLIKGFSKKMVMEILSSRTK